MTTRGPAVSVRQGAAFSGCSVTCGAQKEPIVYDERQGDQENRVALKHVFKIKGLYEPTIRQSEDAERVTEMAALEDGKIITFNFTLKHGLERSIRVVVA